VLNEDWPLFAFAGIWTKFKRDRGDQVETDPGPHLIYGFLTTASDAAVKPIHEKVMRVRRPRAPLGRGEVPAATAAG
jgi:putative SOS response-associated peptidase YedK